MTSPFEATAVLVTVVESRGSVPRGAGTRMVVRADDIVGTIGGGHLEWQAMSHARALLRQWASTRAGDAPLHSERTMSLGPALGQCCGGALRLRFEACAPDALPDPPPAFHLQLHGAGHVGHALVRTLQFLPCSIRWIDSRSDLIDKVRAEFLSPVSPMHARIGIEVDDDPVASIDDAPPGTNFLVMTHRHDLDFALGEAILRRDDFRFFGMIGSDTKRARFIRQWAARGIAEDRIARFECPIGIDGIGGKEPERIAISVAAQLLQVAEQHARIEPTGCGDGQCPANPTHADRSIAT